MFRVLMCMHTITLLPSRLLQVLLEPSQDMLQALNAQPGMTAARESMALPLEAHEKYFASQVFQSREKLLGLLDIAAQVLLAVQN